MTIAVGSLAKADEFLTPSPSASASPSGEPTPEPEESDEPEPTETTEPTVEPSAEETPTVDEDARSLDPLIDFPVEIDPEEFQSMAMRSTSSSRYIQSLVPAAQQGQIEFGVPASVSLAQSILEAGWGGSDLSQYGQAYFGIKCTKTMSRYQSGCINLASDEFYDGAFVSQISGFRTYQSVTDAFLDHGLFLRENSRYAPAFKTTNADDFARAIANAGYATDPAYASKLISIMNSNGLKQYDNTSVSAPALSLSGGWQQVYQALGGISGPLSFAVGAPMEGPISGSQIQSFDRGAIIYSPASGYHALHGAVWDLYRSSNNFRQANGLPVSNEISSAAGGVYQDFQNGQVFWSDATGAQRVGGAIAWYYGSLTGPTSYLGYPTGGEISAGNGGVYQNFQNGRIYWSDASGAHALHGAVWYLFNRLGAASGYLGYPTTDEKATDGGGVIQTFQGGWVVWGPQTDAYPLHGGIGWAYVNLDGPSSYLGYPISSEQSRADGGAMQEFQGGRIYWDDATGTAPTHGAIGWRYSDLSGPSGYLGYPVAAERPAPGGGSVQDYQGGQIFWSDATGAWPVHGAVRWLYDDIVSGDNYLGYPTTAENPAPSGGIYQNFQNGQIYWSDATGAMPIHGAIGSLYLANGGPGGSLGYPVTQERNVSVSGGATDGSNTRSTETIQSFQHGTIHWTPARGAWITI
ncbi:MAG: glucosaminidase domain-containing protein [Propionibacteriaceae bacterium]|nr:glucosaminidase domain-containing protein [Propionibacteriaceae bacterium]